MALIVETGSALATAESYASAADADAHHLAFGNTAWAGDAATKEAALRRATVYLSQMYRMAWKGHRVQPLQALDWPRHDVSVDDLTAAARYAYVLPHDAIPREVKHACMELALEALAGPLAGNLEQGVTSESVGPIATSYDRGTPQWTRFRRIDMLLSPLLASSGPMRRLVRT